MDQKRFEASILTNEGIRVHRGDAEGTEKEYNVPVLKRGIRRRVLGLEEE